MVKLFTLYESLSLTNLDIGQSVSFVTVIKKKNVIYPVVHVGRIALIEHDYSGEVYSVRYEFTLVQIQYCGKRSADRFYRVGRSTSVSENLGFTPTYIVEVYLLEKSAHLIVPYKKGQRLKSQSFPIIRFNNIRIPTKLY